MTLYKFTITPLTYFGTPLKGDTLFGQLCWYVRYIFGEEKLKSLLGNYEKTPFIIISDAFPASYLPKPNLTSKLLNENPDKKKENRKKIWILPQDLANGMYENSKTFKKIKNQDKTVDVVRNSINYHTFTTDSKGFDPYGNKEYFYEDKDIYILLNSPDFSIDDLNIVLKAIGFSGYGKDATIGKGRFKIKEYSKVTDSFWETESNVFMGLSSFAVASPPGFNNTIIKDAYYNVLTRFGKLGGMRVSSNPFKNPILLADTAGVVKFKHAHKLQYVGCSINNVSTYKDVVSQGYAITFPLKKF